MPVAITRHISPRFAECELTHLERRPIDVDIARAQHQMYIRALSSLDCRVVELPAETNLPDCVFVEDTALVLPEIAVITRPGAPSRRPEITSTAEILQSYRDLIYIREPATLDGGDVLVLDHNIYVGLSTRSGEAAIEQIQFHLKKFGYKVWGVQLHDCLHLKSAVTRLDSNTVLINRRWVDINPFGKYELVDIAPSEPFAANILMIGQTGIYPTAFPETENKLRLLGQKLLTVDVSELAKAEGGVTCCSLIID